MAGREQPGRKRRLLWERVMEGLYAVGLCYGAFPPHEGVSPWSRVPGGESAADRPGMSARASGPPLRHPERVRPDLPLSSLERSLARELRGRR